MSPATKEHRLYAPEPHEIDGEQAESNSEDETSDSESDFSEDKEERQIKVSVKALFDEVLDKIRDEKLDLTNKDQYEDFAAHDGKHLTSQTGSQDQPTVLHIMASKDKNDLPKFDSKMQPLVELLAEQEDYLTVQNRSGHTSLFIAIETKKKEMVRWICDAQPNISRVLAITGSRKMNCLHAGVNKRVRFLDLLIEKADPEVLAAKDEDGNTPLHLAVEYKKCKREQLQFIKKMIDRGDHAVLTSGPDCDFNRDDLSPYLRHKESVRKAREKEKEKEKEKKQTREGVERGKASRSYMNPSTADIPSKDTRIGQRGGIPSQRGHMGGRASRPDRPLMTQPDHSTEYGVGNAVQDPVISPTVPDLGEYDEEERPSRATESAVSHKRYAGDEKSNSKVDEFMVKNVEHFLKLHYLRTRSYNAALEILYGRNTTLGKLHLHGYPISLGGRSGIWTSN